MKFPAPKKFTKASKAKARAAWRRVKQLSKVQQIALAVAVLLVIGGTTTAAVAVRGDEKPTANAQTSHQNDVGASAVAAPQNQEQKTESGSSKNGAISTNTDSVKNNESKTQKSVNKGLDFSINYGALTLAQGDVQEGIVAKTTDGSNATWQVSANKTHMFASVSSGQGSSFKFTLVVKPEATIGTHQVTITASANGRTSTKQLTVKVTSADIQITVLASQPNGSRKAIVPFTFTGGKKNPSISVNIANGPMASGTKPNATVQILGPGRAKLL